MKTTLVAALLASGALACAQDLDMQRLQSQIDRAQSQIQTLSDPASAGALKQALQAARAAEFNLEPLQMQLDQIRPQTQTLSDPASVAALKRAIMAARDVEGIELPDVSQVDRRLQALKAQTAQIMGFADSKPLAEARLMAEMAQDFAFAQSAGIGYSVGAGKSTDDRDYQHGTRALDKGQFDDAISIFNEVIAKKGARADGAYYWKAYAQNRSGHRAEALATIAELRRNFPQSRWLNDAQELEVEIHSQEGKPVSPESENNEEMKLIAINSLMNSDSAQAVPILRKLLVSNQSPAIKDKAMFVLSQSGSPEAREAILDMARGKSNPDLQIKAIRYINMMGNQDTRGELSKIYASSNDVNLKREIIRGYLMSGSKTQLLAVAKGERNSDLRREAIRTLAQSGGKDEIWALYKAENDPGVKEEIVRSMLMDGDSAHLAEIAKTDKDPNLRKAAINTYALTGAKGEDLVDMYRTETDPSIKRELIKGLFLQQNAHALIQLARAEKDPEMKRQIVSQLSLIQSKEATDYFMEILK